MKKLWFGILVTLLITVFVPPAFSWDFSMMGQFEWRYRYFGRANGYQDLFGDMRLQDNPIINQGFGTGTGPIGFAGQNLWRGYNGQNNMPMPTGSWGSEIRIVRAGNSYADCDASEYDQRMTFLPQIRINNAIRLRSNLDLAAIRQKYNHRDFQTNGPLDRWYQDRLSQNAFDTAMIPSINQWYVTVQLPWGLLSAGQRDFPYGTGAILGMNTRMDALVFFIPYGPFRFIPVFWLTQNPYGFGAFTPYQVIPNDPYDPTSNHTGPAPNTVPSMDSGTHCPFYGGILMTYSNGPVEFGGGFAEFTVHSNNVNLGEWGLVGYRPVYLNLASPAPSKMYGFGGFDQFATVWTAFLKYNNGRYYTNMEYGFANIDSYFLGYGQTPRLGSQVSGAPQLYVEAPYAFIETGILCGPAKLSGMLAWSGGPALNNGNPTKSYSGLTINYQATDAYNYLLFKNFGGGNDAPWQSGVTFMNDDYGQMSDAWCLAARLDYAVAANLNVWGSYMWANRVEENGWLAGQKDWNGNPATGAVGNGLPWTVADAQRWKAFAMPGAGAAANMNPYVDDCYLGWEADIGVDWKLLENMAVMTRYAYWQPGPWFDQAYQVVGLNGAGAAAPNAAPAPGVLGGFMQGRSAIQSFSSSILIDF